MICSSIGPSYTLHNVLFAGPIFVRSQQILASAPKWINDGVESWHILRVKMLRSRKYDRHFALGIFQMRFLHWQWLYFINIRLGFVTNGTIENLPALVQVMVWCWTGAKPFSVPLMAYFTDPDSKVHGANIGPIWGRQDPGGPHVGPRELCYLGRRTWKLHELICASVICLGGNYLLNDPPHKSYIQTHTTIIIMFKFYMLNDG